MRHTLKSAGALAILALCAACAGPILSDDLRDARSILARAGVDPIVIDASLREIEAKVAAQEARSEAVARSVQETIPQPLGTIIGGVVSVATAIGYSIRRAKKSDEHAEMVAREEAQRMSIKRDQARISRGERVAVPMQQHLAEERVLAAESAMTEKVHG